MSEGYLMPLRILLIGDHLQFFLKVCFFSHNCSVRSNNVSSQKPRHLALSGASVFCVRVVLHAAALRAEGKQSRRAVENGQPGLQMPLRNTNESVYRSTNSRKVLGNPAVVDS